MVKLNGSALKSMWKSVKQPFTLIRQYLQHMSEKTEKNSSVLGITGGKQRACEMLDLLPLTNADAGEFSFLKYPNLIRVPHGEAL